MNKVFRKVRIDLSKYDADWKNSFILIATTGFKESVEHEKQTSKLNRELFYLSRELERVQSKLKFDATLGKDSDKEFYDQEEKLSDKLDSISLKIISLFHKVVADKFISGMIFDGELKKDRAMVKEDIEMFDKEVLEEIAYLALGNPQKKV